MTDQTDPRALVERLTGFSPGPWRMSDDLGTTQIRSADNTRLMCDETYYPSVPENQNDWEIIAAAPDLHAALTAALDRAEKAEAAMGVAYRCGWNGAIEAVIERIADSWSWDDADFMAEVYDDLRRNLNKGDPT